MTWTHLRTAPAPFGEPAWAHARDILARRGSDHATESEIAARPRTCSTRPGTARGPAAGPARQDQAAGRTRSPRSRRVARTRRGHRRPAVAPARPRRPGTAGPPAGREASEAEPAGEVIPLPFFDAREEAKKWW